MPSKTVAVKVRECKQETRDSVTGIRQVCGTPYKGENCSNRDSHIRPIPTGFCCGKHQCEGTKPRSPSGKPMKTCSFWLVCPCQCHDDLSEMYLMLGRERRLVDNPEWVVPESSFVMPERVDVLRADKLSTEPAPKIIEGDAVRIPDTIIREFAPTESGRAARGQLEQNVHEACDAWLRDKVTEPCSTKWVSAWIAENLGVPNTSRGAIQACWNRWTNIEFAHILDSPTQFLRYTREGVNLGLEEMKARAKRSRNQASNARKLGHVR